MRKRLLYLCILFTCTLLTAQEQFENKTFGFWMDMPAGWIEGSNEELALNLEKLEIDDYKLSKIIRDHKGSVLLLSLYKYDPETHTGLIPAIQINVRERNNEDFEEFKDDITASAKRFDKLYENFNFIDEPENVKISRIKSIYFATKFTMHTDNGQTHRVRSRIYVIPYKHYYFQVNMTDNLMGEDCGKEFSGLIKSVKIKRK